MRETRLPEPTSARQRLRLVPAVAAVARRTHADLWHIHDYYLLPHARRWSRRTGRPVLYDVHEYYPEYYSQRFAAPAPVQHAARRLVAGAERWYAGRLGAANAVSEQLADRFRALGLPAVATPNYPSADAFARPARPLTPDLLRRVVHTGSLTTDYGADVLVGRPWSWRSGRPTWRCWPSPGSPARRPGGGSPRRWRGRATRRT
ncbi:glycosyltransferase [Micromonospora echinospora]|uniref:glycosyltransferase n=1 Tax=Micromonospora echinospora TaxID=1877 RepID=UPI003A8C3382